MNRSIRWLVLAAAAGVLLLVWLRADPRGTRTPAPEVAPPPDAAATDSDRSRRAPSHREDAAARRDAATASSGIAPAPPVPASSPPATKAVPGLPVDANGNFLPTARTVSLFEASLATDQPLDRSVAAIRAGISRDLEPPAEAQALEFLDRYLAYRSRGIELGLNQDVTEDFRPRFAQLRSLRREFFGIEVAQRLFGEEERAANIVLRENEITGDPDLSEEEKAARLAELHNPPPERND